MNRERMMAAAGIVDPSVMRQSCRSCLRGDTEWCSHADPVCFCTHNPGPHGDLNPPLASCVNKLRGLVSKIRAFAPVWVNKWRGLVSKINAQIVMAWLQLTVEMLFSTRTRTLRFVKNWVGCLRCAVRHAAGHFATWTDNWSLCCGRINIDFFFLWLAFAVFEMPGKSGNCQEQSPAQIG
jgi:hypothetical protein